MRAETLRSMIEATLPDGVPVMVIPVGEVRCRITFKAVSRDETSAESIREQVMPLISQLFRSNRRLQECLIKDSAHVTKGSQGVHVALIQYAVLRFESGQIEGREISAKLYGPTTAAAVLAYKTRRRIINFAYQRTADNVVGRLTIAALDREMAAAELRDFGRNILPF